MKAGLHLHSRVSLGGESSHSIRVGPDQAALLDLNGIDIFTLQPRTRYQSSPTYGRIATFHLKPAHPIEGT